MSVEHVLGHCSKFQNQQQKYNLEGKSIGAILDDDVDVGSLVGYLQDIKVSIQSGIAFFPLVALDKII